MSVNSVRSSRGIIHSSFFDESSKNCIFLHVAFGSRLQRQLIKHNKTDKSSSSKVLSLKFAYNIVSHVFKFGHNYVLATFFALLLIRQGIEPNPGPSSVTVTSQNCRGLTDPNKLISLLRRAYPRSNESRILCLQETHYLNRFALDNHFKGGSVVDNGERGSNGTAILVPEQFDICLSRVSGNGRWALAAIRDCTRANDADSNPIVVVASIYAPNCHRVSLEFFESFFDVFDEFMEEVSSQYSWPHSIIAGDFNFVFNPDVDSLNRQRSAQESTLAALVESFLTERELLDSICHDRGSNCNFTWRRANCCSRLDHIFISTGLSSRVQSFETLWYSFGSNYDHATINVKIGDKIGIPRGRGFPKLFKSDINSANNITWIKQQLEDAKLQIPSHWNPHQSHDFLKMILRSKTLEARAMNKTHSSSQALKDKINQLLLHPTDEAVREVESLKTELLQAEESEAEVIRLKAGIKWREHGEKSSKYFLGRLKTRELARDMHSLINNSGEAIVGLVSVLDHVRSFYSGLYKKVSTAIIGFNENFFELCPVLDPTQQRNLASPITIAEIRDTLKLCHDSAPGLDGIPYSYYSTFGDILLPSLLSSWNYAIDSGQLAQSHKQSCITLLPKKDKDLKLIQNWRPISLSSCDLKIITKIYAKRLSLILPSILTESQAAYVPGRDISFNNRIIKSAQKFINTHQKDYCVVSLDARKAFDSVSHSYLVKVMNAYQFPEEFVKVFKTLYADNTAVVQVNGHLTSPFQLERGVKQGDALSCGLFVLAIDPLLRNIIANETIKGLTIPTDEQNLVEVKVLAYADDVAIICKNRNLQSIFSEYERLSKASGLELNAEKTEILNLIDSIHVSNRISYLGQEYLLGRADNIKICGLYICRQAEIEYERNVLGAINKMEKIITAWRKRALSLNGRMLAAKTFILSQIVFQAQVLNIATKEIKRIERLIYSFVNGSKSLYGPERIARKKLKPSKEQGGIDGVDVFSFIKAIQIKQFNKANNHHILGTLQSSYEGCDDEISEAVFSFLRTHYRAVLRDGIPDLQQIALVSSIPLKFFLSPNTRGHLLMSESGIRSLYEFQRAINNDRISRTHTNVVIKQLPIVVRALVRSQSCIDSQPSVVISMDEDSLESVDRIKTASLRRRLVALKGLNHPVQAKEVYKQPLWQEPDNWQKNIWQIKNPHLRAYRLKLLYKDIFSNERRHKFGISDSPNCEICGQVESVSHQLFECTNAQRLWDLYSRLTGKSIRNMLQIIMATERIDVEIVKSIIIKRLIQIDRSKNVNLAQLKHEIKQYFRIEAHMSVQSERFWLNKILEVDQS